MYGPLGRGISQPTQREATILPSRLGPCCHSVGWLPLAIGRADGHKNQEQSPFMMKWAAVDSADTGLQARHQTNVCVENVH